MLNAKQRSLLRSKANILKPLVFIGKEGITENLLKEIETVLFHNELIKVGIQKSCTVDIKECAREIADATQSEEVQILGAKITLYKRTDKEDFEHIL